MTKVLIAEDSPTLLESIVLELELRGYEVLQATDGRGALNILLTSEQLPDIVVSDIAMPDMDGYKLLEHVRSDRRLSGIPFLFLTAFNSANSLRLSKELGVDDYIVKPFHADDLVLAMENKLKRIQAFRQTAHSELDDVRQKLLIMMSHELRTPMTSIYGGAEMLADHLASMPDDFVQKMLALIQSGANRMNRLTAKTMALLQIDNGQMKRMYQESRHTHEIHAVVAGAQNILALESDSTDRQLPIIVVGDMQPMYVKGVYDYLVMMVEELLRNAVTFSPGHGTIRVEIQRRDEQVQVSVCDDGIGIAPDNLPHVWERFVQIDRQEFEQQGAGLGLAIVRETARIYGGDCTIESQPDRGTCVTLCLPLAEATENVEAM